MCVRDALTRLPSCAAMAGSGPLWWQWHNNSIAAVDSEGSLLERESQNHLQETNPELYPSGEAM
jgi:hypothetical protein